MPLARLFLAERAAHGARSLSRAAEHVLLSQRYAHRNAAELREAIEMAAVISDEPLIQAEHIFTGPKGEGTVQEIDLTRFGLVRRLTAPKVLGTLRAVVLASFAAIIAASLLRSAEPEGAFANALTWGLWEPSLFVVFLFVGRIWCTVCPLSTAGRLAARIKSFGFTPGAWLKNYSGWFIIAGFLLIIWSEHAFHMTENPRAAGFLLLALFAAAIASAVIWRRESWCRYLCPLGNLGAIYSLPAVLTVRSNPSVCATMCTTHECFKGSSTRPGCPVFHHPLYACEAHACKQCYECLRVCPHGSARLYLRLPFQSVWAQPEVGGALVPFALFLFFFAPAMLASQGGTWAATHAGFLSPALVALAGDRRRDGSAAAAARGRPGSRADTLHARGALPARAGVGAGHGLPARPHRALASLHLHAQPGSLLATLLPRRVAAADRSRRSSSSWPPGFSRPVCLVGIQGVLRREQGAVFPRRLAGAARDLRPVRGRGPGAGRPRLTRRAGPRRTPSWSSFLTIPAVGRKIGRGIPRLAAGGARAGTRAVGAKSRTAGSAEPVIVGFLCSWCAYRAADAAGVARISLAPNMRPIQVMCSGRVDPEMVLKSFREGADGVLIVGCHPGACHYVDGGLKALKRFTLLRLLLPQLGLEKERVQLAWAARFRKRGAGDGDRAG